jgi:hypothetical protein
MAVPRHRARKALTFLGIVGLIGAVQPTRIGYQDLASLIAKQRSVGERWRQHLIASPFGTIHAATFSFPTPVGSSIPAPPAYQLASLDTHASDVAGPFPAPRFFGDPEPQRAFPEVNRVLKGDRLVVPAREPASPPPRYEGVTAQEKSASLEAGPDGTPDFSIPTPLGAELQIAAFVPGALPVEPSEADEVNADLQDSDTEAARRDTATPGFDTDSSPLMQTARAYFSIEPMNGDAFGRIVPWADGETPTEAVPEAGPAKEGDKVGKSGTGGGETFAAKGEKPIDRLKSPAERLGLEGTKRAKAEKCLADAVYFEARGEQPRGQMAVAQVVMNRVFSGFYPSTVCGVVYQNAHRYLACQFTFACDGIPDRITEPDAWELAKKIARDTLDGNVWLPEVGKATHYHAYWVRPGWVREMHKLQKIGVHTFYRPRAWGDGAEAPKWGSAGSTAEAKKL